MYRPIEDKITKTFGPFVGNTHTETSETGMRMTYAYHRSHEIIKKHVNASFQQTIQDDSFYGQNVVDFSDVQERMRELEQNVGDAQSLLIFLKKCLPFFESDIQEKRDKKYPVFKCLFLVSCFVT